ncbi:TPA: hypothetical protein OXR36_003827, partial [Acinetobacter baumannii]|nr:hypothetical protein [Acinetobacter baumannii]
MIDFNFIIDIHNELSDFNIDEELTLKDIYIRIEQLIYGEKSTFEFLYKLKDEFLLEYLVNNNENYKSIFNNLTFICDNLKSTVKFNDDINNLKEAYKYCIYASKKNLQTPHGYTNPKIKCLADSILFFESKGIKNLLQKGKVNFDLAKKIENIINNQFKFIGIDGLVNILNTIPQLYDT